LENLTSAYYCWRANTAKMQNLLAESFPEDHAKTKEIQIFLTEKITADFLDLLAQALLGKGDDPMKIFHGYALTDAHLRQRTRALEKNISGCVDKALQLFAEMRLGRCHYVFQWIRDGPLNSGVEIYSGQREYIPKADECDGLGLRAKYCVNPALVKYGDDYGKNFHRKEFLTPAQVVVDVEQGSGPETGENEKSTPNSGKEKTSLMRKTFSLVKTVIGVEYEVEEDSTDKRLSDEGGDDTLPPRLEVNL